MSMMTDRILPTNLAVLRNTLNDDSFVKRGRDKKEEFKLLDLNTINLEEGIEQIPLEEIIQTLDSIAKEKRGEKLGFHDGEPKDKKDLILAKKAIYLVHALASNPTKEILETALEFIELIELIKDLEDIAKQRKDPNFGFKSTPKSKEDISLGQKAADIALVLAVNPTSQNVKVAVKFLGLVELIEELESVSKDKTKRETMGFHSQNKEKEEVKLGESALKIAQVLKKSPTKENIKTAMGFLELIGVFDSMKFKKSLKNRLNDCIGFGCIPKNNKKSLQKVA